MDSSPPSFLRRRFTAILIAVLGLAAVGVFFVLTYYARAGIAERRETNRANLSTIARALGAYAAAHQRAYPEDPLAIYPEYLSDRTCLINPSWPQEPGYIFVSSADVSAAPESILIFENVPERKQKLGRLIVKLSGAVELLQEPDFQARLLQQEAQWKSAGRRWRLVPLDPWRLDSK